MCCVHGGEEEHSTHTMQTCVCVQRLLAYDEEMPFVSDSHQEEKDCVRVNGRGAFVDVEYSLYRENLTHKNGNN